jgi:hypothetical protein
MMTVVMCLCLFMCVRVRASCEVRPSDSEGVAQLAWSSWAKVH